MAMQLLDYQKLILSLAQSLGYFAAASQFSQCDDGQKLVYIS
jgi:hypothetical protein